MDHGIQAVMQDESMNAAGPERRPKGKVVEIEPGSSSALSHDSRLRRNSTGRLAGPGLDMTLGFDAEAVHVIADERPC